MRATTTDWQVAVLRTLRAKVSRAIEQIEDDAVEVSAVSLLQLLQEIQQWLLVAVKEARDGISS